MGTGNLKKPLPQLVRALAPLGATFDASPLLVHVQYAELGYILVDYARGVDEAMAFPSMKVEYVDLDEDGAEADYDFTIEDGGSLTAAADGFHTPVDTAIKDFPARDGAWAYLIDLRAVRAIRVAFMESSTTPIVNPGSLRARIALRNA